MRRLLFAVGGLGMVLAVGCGEPTPVERVVNASQATVDLLKSITDPPSATAAIDKIKPTFDELGKANAGMLAMVTDPSKALSLMTQSGGSMEEMVRVNEELKAETNRLDKLKGLPAEFWNVLRVESYRLGVTSVSGMPGGEELAGPMQQVCSIYDQYGPQRVVELKFVNSDFGDTGSAMTRLQELAGKDAQIVEIEDPSEEGVRVVTVAPIEDYDKFIASIDFGDVIDSEKARGEARVELDEVEEESLAEDEVGDPAAGADQAAAPMVGSEEPQPSEFAGEETGAPQGEAPSRVNQLMGALSAAAEAHRLAAEAKAAAGPQPGDRDYHAQLAELLFDPESPHHERALTALLKAKPTDVADKKVRSRIATGYRHVAFESGAHMPEAVSGLVKWGGKFSEPLLLELLEKQSTGAEEAIYDGLATLATPESATAVVKRLESSSNSSDAAFACLTKMGVVAEAALVGALPFETPETNRAAIEVLGKIGSKKSTAILRKATKSENAEVKEAALTALRAIQDRGRKDKDK